MSVGISYDLIVADADFKYAATVIRDKADHLQKMLAEYSDILYYLCYEAIVDVLICGKLMELQARIEPLSQIVLQESTALAQELEGYVKRIDEADGFMY